MSHRTKNHQKGRMGFSSYFVFDLFRLISFLNLQQGVDRKTTRFLAFWGGRNHTTLSRILLTCHMSNHHIIHWFLCHYGQKRRLQKISASTQRPFVTPQTTSDSPPDATWWWCRDCPVSSPGVIFWCPKRYLVVSPTCFRPQYNGSIEDRLSPLWGLFFFFSSFVSSCLDRWGENCLVLFDKLCVLLLCVWQRCHRVPSVLKDSGGCRRVLVLTSTSSFSHSTWEE